MAKVIKNRRSVSDSWRQLDDTDRLLRPDETGLVPDIPEGDIIVPLALWRIRRSDLSERNGRLGIVLDGHDEPETIAADLERFDVVAIRIPVFSDGRGYSLARLLRERYGYGGELRAVGDVLRDQLFYLSRVGFDAFALREDQNIEEALTAFDDFSEGYQASAERPAPLFRRRLADTNRLTTPCV